MKFCILIDLCEKQKKIWNTVGSWTLKFKFYFVVTTHEPLHLDKWRFVQWKIMDIPTSFIWNIVFFEEDFDYDSSLKFWGFVWTNAEPLCVEFCNFVQWHTFVHYLRCEISSSHGGECEIQICLLGCTVPCKITVDRHFRGTCCLHHQGDKSSCLIALMMEAACTSETSVDNYFTWQYIPEDKSELHYLCYYY
jgi:hypothetical protein